MSLDFDTLWESARVRRLRHLVLHSWRVSRHLRVIKDEFLSAAGWRIRERSAEADAQEEQILHEPPGPWIAELRQRALSTAEEEWVILRRIVVREVEANRIRPTPRALDELWTFWKRRREMALQSWVHEVEEEAAKRRLRAGFVRDALEQHQEALRGLLIEQEKDLRSLPDRL